MDKAISLKEYVKRRNGLPLGASGSLTNMLKRSLGAGSFQTFWRYWNPVWGYYLSRNVMRPLSRWLPAWLAVLATFLVSGALHDLAVSAIKREIIFVITPWFAVMGLAVLVTTKLGWNYANYPWLGRASINAFIVVASLLVSLFVSSSVV